MVAFDQIITKEWRPEKRPSLNLIGNFQSDRGWADLAKYTTRGLTKHTFGLISWALGVDFELGNHKKISKELSGGPQGTIGNALEAPRHTLDIPWDQQTPRTEKPCTPRALGPISGG